MKPKIFCWINGGRGSRWVKTLAMDSEGKIVTALISPSEEDAKTEIMQKCMEICTKRYPEGFELDWVEIPRRSEELMEAYRKNQLCFT